MRWPRLLQELGGGVAGEERAGERELGQHGAQAPAVQGRAARQAQHHLRAGHKVGRS